MFEKLLWILRVFLKGIGLKIVLSFIPPVAVAWTFFILYLDMVHTHNPDQFWTALVLGLVGIAAGSAIVFWLILTTVPPLRHIIESTIRLEGGDLQSDIPYRSRRDEIGELGKALQIFKESAIEKKALEDRQKALQQQAETERRAAAKQLSDNFLNAFGGIIKGLLGALGQQDGSVDALRRAIVSAAKGVQDVSRASQEAYANISAIAAASEELAASSREIGRQAAHSRDVSEMAASGVQQTNQQAATLKDAAQRIGDVVALINGIAGQTNLLALNATIEAARAGELGKGFAVVANEVKVLANQTEKATQEIAQHVEEIQASIQALVDNVGNVVGTIGQSRDISLTIAEAVEQQIEATTEIARNVHTVVESTASVEGGIASMSEAIGQVETAATDAAEASHRSQKECAAMQSEVASFVSKSA